MLHKRLSWIPLLLYSGFIFYMSSGSAPRLPLGDFVLKDKLLHAGAYGVWGILCAWASLKTWPEAGATRLVFWGALAGTLYGLSDELHQSFVPPRVADPSDLAADAVGCLLGTLAMVLLHRRKERSGPVS